MTSTWWSRLTSEDKSEEELNSNQYAVYIERLFKIRQRNTSIAREVKCGFSHFFSCSFILAVNPSLLQYAGFSPDKVAAATAISAGTSCIISGFFSNLPFVLAPTTSTSLYFALFLQNRNLKTNEGNLAVFVLGFLLFLCGLRPVALFISHMIPFVIKVGICLGVGLLIALESLTEIGLVRSGERTVLDIGEFNAKIYIAMVAFIVIGIALHYRIRGAFLIGLVLGTVMYWVFLVLDGKGDVHVSSSDVFVGMSDLTMSFASFTLDTASRSIIYRLVFDLYVIGVILLNGLAHGLSEMAGIKREDGTLPRGKWLYAACGVGTILSSLLGSGPIMISPESAPGIKSGARTGLSAVVCGMLFLLSTILCPLFAKVPSSGTSPVLLMIGMMLFENAGKVNWSSVKEALPVFLMSVFIPFTYSIFNGVIFGFGIYAVLYVCTEDNASARIHKQAVKYLACCYSCCGWRDGALTASNKPTGRDYQAVNGAHSALHEEEEGQDLRDLSFELNEISNQFAGDGDADSDLVSIRLSGLSAAAPNSRSSSTSSQYSSYRAPSTSGGSSLANTSASSGGMAQQKSAPSQQPFGSYLQGLYRMGGTQQGSTDAAREGGGAFRSVNAGAGSLFSLLGGGRDASNTPDWVLESSSKL